MLKNIKLSIIIVNFNTAEFLKNCIDSIYKNAGILEPEIIVVDNASKEELRIANNEFRIKIIKNKKNVGFAAANNQGIKEARGQYILLLNPDTLITNNVFEQMVGFMKNNPDVGIATCKVVLESGELDDACHRGFPTPWNSSCYFLGLSNFFPKSKLFNGYHLGYADLDKTHEIDACAGAFMMINRQAGQQVKWLDGDYFWYGEDLDFCYRMKQSGWKIMFVPEFQILHYKGVSGGIKKHSAHLSTADRETKLFATKARFEVMRIFYEKHYKDKYPSWLTYLVITAINIKEYLTLQRYN